MILILTEEQDPHADAVIAALRRKSARYARFHTADFPQKVRLTMRFRDGEDGVLLCIGDETVRASDVRTVWYRRPRLPVLSDALGAEDKKFALDESGAVLRGLWSLLQDRFWVNPRDASNAAEAKAPQLELARAIGFEIPRTLITNDPAELAPFVERCGGDAIYKTFTQYTREQDGTVLAIYTNRLRPEDVARADSLTHAPGLFQEYVPKKLELRVTVIGRKVFAAEIHSQQSERAKHDWRRYDLAHTPHRPHELPPAVAARCLELVRGLGLVFGCIDLILTPDERYVFLEINPNGQWYWVEELTQLPLLDNFSAMLIQGTPEYADPLPAETGAVEPPRS